MLEVLRDKKVIFFDIGYTLDYPASGDWFFVNKFDEIAGDRLCKPEDAVFIDWLNKLRMDNRKYEKSSYF